MTSGGAVRSVIAPNPGRLINLSVLTDIVRPGDDLTLGYVVGGSGTTGAKPRVIRASGSSLGAFGVMTHLAGADDSDQKLDHYAGLAKENLFLATVLAIGLGSLAGIPPLAGFMGKFLVFVAVFQAGHGTSLLVAIIGVVISIYYSFGWIKAAFFETWTQPVDSAAAPLRPARTPVGTMTAVALGTLALASIVLGFYQGPLGQWLGMK